jgi:hypothetical protein
MPMSRDDHFYITFTINANLIRIVKSDRFFRFQVDARVDNNPLARSNVFAVSGAKNGELYLVRRCTQVVLFPMDVLRYPFRFTLRLLYLNASKKSRRKII